MWLETLLENLFSLSSILEKYDVKRSETAVGHKIDNTHKTLNQIKLGVKTERYNFTTVIWSHLWELHWCK